MDHLLDVRNMEVSFRTYSGTIYAVRDASFTVDKGEVMAIVGESGSGKSVLTQACLRLIPSPPGEINAGEVLFEGVDILRARDEELLDIRGKEISVIFQDAMTALNPTLRIGRQITEMILAHAGFTREKADERVRALMGVRDDEKAVEDWLLQTLRPTPAQLESDREAVRALIRDGASPEALRAWLTRRGKVTKEQARRQAVELLTLVKIPSPEKRMRQYIFQLSGGMRQRVMIAMAMACRPKLIIADEPTTALDVTIKSEILDLLASLTRQLGMSIILITHDLGMVASYASRIGVMYGGQFVETGTGHEIFYDAHHPYTRGLMKAVPRLDLSRDQTLETIPGAPPNLRLQPKGCAFSPRCTYCMEICRAEMPPETSVSPTHSFRCWLWDSRAEAQRALFLKGGEQDGRAADAP